MITIVELKKRLIFIYIFYITISKFGYSKRPSLVILFIINKTLEIVFYYTIFYLALFVNLWVKNSRNFVFDSKQIAN